MKRYVSVCFKITTKIQASISPIEEPLKIRLTIVLDSRRKFEAITAS